MKTNRPSFLTPQKQKQHGAVLAEFCLIIPLLASTLFLLLEFGRALTQISWLYQTTYLAAMWGSEALLPNAQAEQETKSLYESYFDEQSRSQLTRLPAGTNARFIVLAGGSMAVQINTEADLSKLVTVPFPLKLKLQLVSPYLMSGNTIGNASQFENPSGCFDWTGNPISSALPCLS